MKENRILPCCVVLLAAIALAGCPTGPSEEELALANMQEQAKAVTESQTTLNQNRADQETAKATLAELEAISERKRTDEQKLQVEELTGKLPELKQVVDTGYDDLQEKLAEFLTLALNEFPQAPETLDGMRVYSEEAILTAEETIRESGNYKKAMENLISAKDLYDQIELAPLPALVDKIGEYEDWRFITRERFDQVKRGMTPEEVKEVIGVPYYRNIRENPNKTKTWIYQRREGGAAAITFNAKNKVYHTNFDAVQPKVAE